MSDVSELLSIVTEIIKRLTAFDILLLVGISAFLITYFDTSSLHAALGISLSIVSLMYIVEKAVEPFIRIGVSVMPKEGELTRYIAALLKGSILYVLGYYLNITSLHQPSNIATRAIPLIVVIGCIGYILLYLDHVMRITSHLSSHNDRSKIILLRFKS